MDQIVVGLPVYIRVKHTDKVLDLVLEEKGPPRVVQSSKVEGKTSQHFIFHPSDTEDVYYIGKFYFQIIFQRICFYQQILRHSKCKQRKWSEFSIMEIEQRSKPAVQNPTVGRWKFCYDTNAQSYRSIHQSVDSCLWENQ